MLVIVGLSILAAAAFAIHRWWQPDGAADLGSVTERWLAEHRAHHPTDSR